MQPELQHSATGSALPATLCYSSGYTSVATSALPAASCNTVQQAVHCLLHCVATRAALHAAHCNTVQPKLQHNAAGSALGPQKNL